MCQAIRAKAIALTLIVAWVVSYGSSSVYLFSFSLSSSLSVGRDARTRILEDSCKGLKSREDGNEAFRFHNVLIEPKRSVRAVLLIN